MTAPSSGFWDRFAHRVLARPLLSWAGALVLMVPLAVLGTRTTFTQDTLLELPAEDRLGRRPPPGRREVRAGGGRAADRGARVRRATSATRRGWP